MSFGGTKNGMMYGEAVVFCDPALGADAKFIRKQATQLPSKMRFVAAQFEALLTDDLWIRNAAHANAMAQRLGRGDARHPRRARSPASPRSTASSSACPRHRSADLQAESFFWTWDGPSTRCGG